MCRDSCFVLPSHRKSSAESVSPKQRLACESRVLRSTSTRLTYCTNTHRVDIATAKIPYHFDGQKAIGSSFGQGHYFCSEYICTCFRDTPAHNDRRDTGSGIPPSALVLDAAQRLEHGDPSTSLNITDPSDWVFLAVVFSLLRSSNPTFPSGSGCSRIDSHAPIPPLTTQRRSYDDHNTSAKRVAVLVDGSRCRRFGTIGRLSRPERASGATLHIRVSSHVSQATDEITLIADNEW